MGDRRPAKERDRGEAQSGTHRETCSVKMTMCMVESKERETSIAKGPPFSVSPPVVFFVSSSGSSLVDPPVSLRDELLLPHVHGPGLDERSSTEVAEMRLVSGAQV